MKEKYANSHETTRNFCLKDINIILTVTIQKYFRETFTLQSIDAPKEV